MELTGTVEGSRTVQGGRQQDACPSVDQLQGGLDLTDYCVEAAKAEIAPEER